MISVEISIHCKPPGKYSCAVCRKGVGKNLTFCGGYSFWVHKKCSDNPGRLFEDPVFRCRCLRSAQAIDGRPCVAVEISGGKLDVVDNFIYLGDCTCPVGGCELATTNRCRSPWRKFRELLLLLTCKQCQMYNSCVRGIMLCS